MAKHKSVVEALADIHRDNFEEAKRHGEEETFSDFRDVASALRVLALGVDAHLPS